MGCGASKHAGVEEAPVYKATADVHPRDGVMLVKGKALLTLAEHGAVSYTHLTLPTN